MKNSTLWAEKSAWHWNISNGPYHTQPTVWQKTNRHPKNQRVLFRHRHFGAQLPRIFGSGVFLEAPRNVSTLCYTSVSTSCLWQVALFSNAQALRSLKRSLWFMGKLVYEGIGLQKEDCIANACRVKGVGWVKFRRLDGCH